jgi:hypothetical protein
VPAQVFKIFSRSEGILSLVCKELGTPIVVEAAETDTACRKIFPNDEIRMTKAEASESPPTREASARRAQIDAKKTEFLTTNGHQ